MKTFPFTQTTQIISLHAFPVGHFLTLLRITLVYFLPQRLCPILPSTLLTPPGEQKWGTGVSWESSSRRSTNTRQWWGKSGWPCSSSSGCWCWVQQLSPPGGTSSLTSCATLSSLAVRMSAMTRLSPSPMSGFGSSRSSLSPPHL